MQSACMHSQLSGLPLHAGMPLSALSVPCSQLVRTLKLCCSMYVQDIVQSACLHAEVAAVHVMQT